jgi:single-strand DNA-binding protein
MSGINKAILIGRLGSDPETRYTPSGVAVSNFNIATSEEWKDKDTGEKKDRTEWHRIVAWNKLGEGRIQTRSWEDKDGNKRYTTEIVATDVQFLGSKNENSNSIQAPEDDDIPF